MIDVKLGRDKRKFILYPMYDCFNYPVQHFVIKKSMYLINLHFWTYLLKVSNVNYRRGEAKQKKYKVKGKKKINIPGQP